MRKTAKHLDAAEFSRFFSTEGLQPACELIWKADALLGKKRSSPARVALFASEVISAFPTVAENFGVHDQVSLGRKVLFEAADYPALEARAAAVLLSLTALLEQANEPSPETIA